MNQLSKAEKKEMRKVADDFLQAVKEEVDSAVLFEDMDRLKALVNQVQMVIGYGVHHKIQEAGLQKEITALCDRAGEILRDRNNSKPN